MNRPIVFAVRMWLTVMILVVLAGSGAAAAQGATPVASPVASGYAHPEWLADAAWLNEHLADPALAIVALTPAEDFTTAHVPGAAQVDWPAFEITETSDQSVAVWETEVEAIFTSLGIERGDTVVVYDGGTLYAARVWWLLYQLGHDDVRILNGGLPAWTEAGFAVDNGASEVQPASTPYAGVPDESAIAQIGKVEASIGHPGVILIDARRPDEYLEGHIPGAFNIVFTANAASEGPKYWKSAEELRTLYAGIGVTAETQVIPYCTTGVRSAATYFALRQIGYDNVSLFSGSYKEWSSDAARAVTKGDQP